MSGKRFFDDRNGADELTITMMVAGIILILAYSLFTLPVLQIVFIVLGVGLFGLGLFRAFSKNVGKRRAENASFVSFFKGGNKEARARAKAERDQQEALRREKAAQRKADEKIYTFFHCPKCRQELRVPKGKGKIMIRCPKCGEKFQRKS